MHRQACSQCGCMAYVRGSVLTADAICEVCGHEVNFRDFQLDAGEKLVWDDDGYLAVVLPE